MAHAGDPSAAPSDTVAALTCKLPDFWAADPLIWFAQVDAIFANQSITNQVTRFHHVVAHLPAHIAMEVRDIILAPPVDQPYDKLKSELIARTSASERKRLQQLLSTEDLGDRKPSQFLRRMYQLLGDKAHTFDTGLLRELFLSRLPSQVRMVLASAANLDLPALADMADNVLEVAAPAMAAIIPPPNTEITQLRAEVAELTKMVRDLTLTVAQARRKTARSPSPAARSRSPDSSGVCWYHRRFGDRSTRCTTPCTYQTGNAPAQH